MGLQWANEYLYNSGKADFTATEKLLAELHAPQVRQYLSYKDPFENHPHKKKEVKEPMAINLVLSLEKFVKFVQDHQAMAPDNKIKVDERGNYVYNKETGDQETIDIPLADRWVNIGKMRVNSEGKIVVEVSAATLDKMELLNARQARIEAYQSK